MNGKRILLIEDEKEISGLLNSRLAAQGYEMDTLEDGGLALNRIQEILPDLIILDLWLPHLSGEEICKAVRESMDERIAKIPILILSAKKSEADQIVGRMLGANHYFTKPADANQLLVQIRKILDN